MSNLGNGVECNEKNIHDSMKYTEIYLFYIMEKNKEIVLFWVPRLLLNRMWSVDRVLSRKKSARIGHVVGWKSRQLPCTNRVFLFPHFFKVDCFPQSSVISIHLHHFNRNSLARQLSRQSSLVANFPRVFFSSVMGSPPLRECSNCFRVSPRWCRKIAAMSSIYTVLCQILYLCKLRI